MITLTQSQLDQIADWAIEGQGDEGDDSRYPSMSYEDGIRDMVSLLEGEMEVDELTGG